jgi:hypothetical protein
MVTKDLYALSEHTFAVVLKPEEIPIYVNQLFTFQHILKSVVIRMSIDMFLSNMRSENVFTISQWCAKRNIQLGCYLTQNDDYLYVPNPSFCRSRVYAFSFHILDSGCVDKYASISDMISYLLRLGIPSHSIAPLYIPMAPYPISQLNMLGYFFRDDLCKHHVERTNQKLHDVAFS